MGIKDLFSSKNHNFEKKVRNYAIYSASEKQLQIVPIKEILKGIKLDFLSNGMNARVYKLKGLNWVIKEGRWDLDIPFLNQIPSFTEKAADLLDQFFYPFFPTQSEILRQYQQYLNLILYFGYFKDKNDFYHPRREKLFVIQQEIRRSLVTLKNRVEFYYEIEFNPKLMKVLSSKAAFANFLPKEYLLWGTSLSKENDKRQTYYIVQEFINGKTMHDVNTKSLPKETILELIVLVYLILVINMRMNILPDTRPRYPFFQIYEFLTKTDNIMISKKDRVKFVDTRWMWETNTDFVRRGMFVPELMINKAKNYLNELLSYVK